MTRNKRVSNFANMTKHRASATKQDTGLRKPANISYKQRKVKKIKVCSLLFSPTSSKPVQPFFCLSLSHFLFLVSTSSVSVFFCNFTPVMMCIASKSSRNWKNTSSPNSSCGAHSSPSSHQHSLLGPSQPRTLNTSSSQQSKALVIQC